MINGARRALYKKFRLEGYSGVASALKAGYTKASANTGRLHHRAGVGLKKALELAGLDDFSLANNCLEGLNATKDSGEKDFYVSHKYLETVLKIRGDLQEKTTSIDKMQVNVYLPQTAPNSITDR